MNEARVSFNQGVCVALQVLASFDHASAWTELVQTAGELELLEYAAHEEPAEWELAGFAKYAESELGRRKPRKSGKA